MIVFFQKLGKLSGNLVNMDKYAKNGKGLFLFCFLLPKYSIFKEKNM